MAENIGSAAVVKLVDNVLSEEEVTVRNDGPGGCFVSKDPQLVSSGADTFQVQANSEQDVTLRPGEALYAICAAGQTASLEVV